ncbi:MAG: hypothetical protein PHP31_07925 [Lentimicrobiaceae bacterium]|nr:hypothetical protein [Lentimicrobiaceae bacterium]
MLLSNTDTLQNVLSLLDDYNSDVVELIATSLYDEYGRDAYSIINEFRKEQINNDNKNKLSRLLNHIILKAIMENTYEWDKDEYMSLEDCFASVCPLFVSHDLMSDYDSTVEEIKTGIRNFCKVVWLELNNSYNPTAAPVIIRDIINSQSNPEWNFLNNSALFKDIKQDATGCTYAIIIAIVGEILDLPIIFSNSNPSVVVFSDSIDYFDLPDLNKSKVLHCNGDTAKIYKMKNFARIFHLQSLVDEEDLFEKLMYDFSSLIVQNYINEKYEGFVNTPYISDNRMIIDKLLSRFDELHQLFQDYYFD